MADVFSREKRSAVMSRIRGKGNRDTELALLQVLRKSHLTGWRRHVSLLGRPDFVFRKQRLAIFVDGCFWHACPRHGSLPANNAAFWQKKLMANKKRDGVVTRGLRRQNWRVIRIWEHDLALNPGRCAKRIAAALRSGDLRSPR